MLVSDFYLGYDSMPCRQQKCLIHLIHLIRDINDELWKAPFDKELEGFTVAVQFLLVPILEAVDHYGLKAWHLRKFLKDVERFYDKPIIGMEYTLEPVRTFQKRLERYRGKPLHISDAGRHFVGEQHGGEGDPPTGHAEEDLTYVFQVSGPAVPAAAGYLADLSFPR